MASPFTRTDPFAAFRFEVTVDDMPVGGFSECTGLVLEMEIHDQSEGGLSTHHLKFPTRAEQNNLVLKRGITGRLLWDWFAAVQRGEFTARDGSVLIRDPGTGAVSAEWQFREAFPARWQGPDLNATQNSVATEALELCHQGLERRT